MIIDEDEEVLMHYGILRRSGRYPWGSSHNVVTRSMDFLQLVQDLKDKGLSDKEIYEGFDMNSSEFRDTKTLALNQKKQSDIRMAEKLRAKGYSHEAIGKRMATDGGKPIAESTIRSWLAPGVKEKADILTTTANMLRDQVDEKGGIDVGKGVEHLIGVSYNKLKAAVTMLRDEGYELHKVNVRQPGTGKFTQQKVLASKGSTQKEFWMDPTKIKQITEMSNDGGRSFFGLHTPLIVDPKRVKVIYKEDGGGEADGVIFVRPKVKDLSLGKSNYAQVRIQVGKGHYLKGMAMYNNDLPKGVDLLFNTAKSKNDVESDLDAMKPLVMDINDPTKQDPDNPFGAAIKIGGQIVDVDENGKETLTSAMNIVNEEGDWKDWSKTLSSQMLSKQSPRLAKSQLDVTFKDKQRELDEINALTNPSIKKKLLTTFSDDVDAAAVHLKAAALSRRQMYQVILPVNSLSENEVYAPNFENGERVVLIRHPHGGTFEIPELIVNNRHPEAKALLGQARDAIGINAKVAERLSGADFDGDAVVVIPDREGKVRITPALEGLKDFDPRSQYKGYEGMKPIDTQLQMGVVSNLITDMTIRGAPPEDLVKAIRHSMVVIDSEKHELDYRQSAIDNQITLLKQRYQTGGASTLISRAGAAEWVPDRKPRLQGEGGPVDPETGELRFVPTNKMVTDKKTGETRPKLMKSKRLAETTDANTLVSDANTPIERTYAAHSNRLKAMANDVRKEILTVKPIEYSKSAAQTYAKEKASLKAKLVQSESNKPAKRAADVIAGAIVKQRFRDNPSIDEDQKKRIRSQALHEARRRTGAVPQNIYLEDDEWNAIQAGAISHTMLNKILDNADIDRVKELATPRVKRSVTPARLARAQAMLASGHTRAEVASALGIPIGTLDEALYQ